MVSSWPQRPSRFHKSRDPHDCAAATRADCPHLKGAKPRVTTPKHLSRTTRLVIGPTANRCHPPCSLRAGTRARTHVGVARADPAIDAFLPNMPSLRSAGVPCSQRVAPSLGDQPRCSRSAQESTATPARSFSVKRGHDKVALVVIAVTAIILVRIVVQSF